MKKIVSLAVTCALAAAVSTPASAAGEYTSTYVAAIAVAASLDETNAAGVAPFGGFSFTPNNGSFRITFADLGAGGAPIAVSVCQTRPNPEETPHLCGDEPQDKDIHAGCSTAGAGASRIDVTGGTNGTSGTFVIGEPIGVFIFANPISCPNAATAGMATAKWPKP